MTKMTYVDAIDKAIEALGVSQGGGEAEVIEKLEALKVQLIKRNSGERKPTKAQKANEALKDEILALLADGKARTISEIAEGVAGLEGASPQKVSALLIQLKKATLVIREEVKRKAYFKLA